MREAGNGERNGPAGGSGERGGIWMTNVQRTIMVPVPCTLHLLLAPFSMDTLLLFDSNLVLGHSRQLSEM